MNDLFIAIIIGIIAGTIDVVPMIIKKLDKLACISAFVHYLVLGIIIPYVSWDIPPWLKGSIIAFLVSLPVMILVIPKDRKALIPMVLLSIVLGAGIGYFNVLIAG